MAATSPVSLGIVLGLVAGKPIGIFCAPWFAGRLGLGIAPSAGRAANPRRRCARRHRLQPPSDSHGRPGLRRTTAAGDCEAGHLSRLARRRRHRISFCCSNPTMTRHRRKDGRVKVGYLRFSWGWVCQKYCSSHAWTLASMTAWVSSARCSGRVVSAEPPSVAPPDTRETHARGTRRAGAPLAANGRAPVLPVCLPAPR